MAAVTICEHSSVPAGPEDLNSPCRLGGQLHSCHLQGHHCGPRGPALQRTPAVFTPKETNGQHRTRSSAAEGPRGFAVCALADRSQLLASLPAPILLHSGSSTRPRQDSVSSLLYLSTPPTSTCSLASHVPTARQTDAQVPGSESHRIPSPTSATSAHARFYHLLPLKSRVNGQTHKWLSTCVWRNSSTSFHHQGTCSLLAPAASRGRH